MDINRKKIKKYFEGKSQLGAIILMVVGFVMMGAGIGIFLLIGGFAWYLYNKFSADLSGESEVDKAREYETECAKARAYEKLNIIDEQVKNVAPVVVTGRGYQPETADGAASSKGFIKILVDAFKKKFLKEVKIKADEYVDPIQMARIGSEGKYRCSLVSTSVFMFGETQLYVYFSNVDLATGNLYGEGTYEFFYSDINAMVFSQEKEKLYNFKKKKYEPILFETVKIYTSGCNYSTTLLTDVDKSIIENEFTGMRNLVREKKNSK